MRETFPLGKMRDGALDYSIGCQILALAFILLSTQVIVALKSATLTHTIGKPLKRLVVLQLMVSRNDRTSLGSGAGFRLTRQH